MSDGATFGLFGLGVFAICVLGWKITRFSYLVEGDTLVIVWFYLGIVPMRRTIDLMSIRRVVLIRRNQLPMFLLKSLGAGWPVVYGKFRKELLYIERDGGFLRSWFISPSCAESFRDELVRAVKSFRG